MAAPVTTDEDVLIPTPKVWKISDKELVLRPLPVKDVLKIVKYVKDQQDLFDKFKEMDKNTPINIEELIKQDVFGRLNGLLRLMFKPGDGRDVLTDEWCENHLTPAHYRAFIVTMLKQNELWHVFLKAKGLLGKNMEDALRQAGL